MKALVLGGADCVWTDLQRFEQMIGEEWKGIVIAVNDIGCHWPRRLDHWVSLHPNKFKKWKPLRGFLQHGDPEIWSRRQMFQTWGKPPVFDDPENVTDHILEPWRGGSSGMFAVQVAKELGCVRAVLCGIPMTATGHFTESQEEFPTAWGSADHHWRMWKAYYHLMDGWTRSMSGRTRDLLGEPTKEWLDGNQEHQ